MIPWSVENDESVVQDGNWNTIAICDTTGSVGERYAYSSYGAPVFMTGAGVVQSASTIGFAPLYAGYRWDNPAPQMYYVRNRFLLPQVGTWNRRDPAGSLLFQVPIPAAAGRNLEQKGSGWIHR